MRELDGLQLRILGVLVEKERTVPETYPLSVNALLAGCNQKSSRDPVMQCTEAQVLAALDGLRALSLIAESSGAKVMRIAHNMERALRLPSLSVVVLAVLMLRGPQTPASLRAHAERMHRFADASSVEGFLHELAERAPEAGGPLVRMLARVPGEREARWTQMLGARPDSEQPPGGQGERSSAEPGEAGQVPDVASTGTVVPSKAGEAGLEERLAAIEARLAWLESRVRGNA